MAMTLDGTSGITQLTGSIVMSGSTSGTVTIIPTATAGSNTATLPAATGTVMVSGNMPAFSIYLGGSTQSISSGAFTKVSFDTTTFDTNSCISSGRFTPNVAGYYQLNTNILFNSIAVTTIIIVAIYKNGGNYARGNGGYLSNTSGDTEILATTLAYANGTTDYFEVYVYQNSGVSKTVYNDAGLTSFNGCMVRRA